MDNDILRNAVIGASASVPYIGGIISFFLDSELPSYLKEQCNNFMSELELGLSDISDRINIERLDSPEVVTLCIKTIRYAVSEYNREKQMAYRNIILNALIEKDSLEMSDFYLHLINVLTKEQFTILNFMYYTDINNQIVVEKVSGLTKLYKENKDFIVSVYSELARLNLASGNSIKSLGKRFCEFINFPMTIWN